MVAHTKASKQSPFTSHRMMLELPIDLYDLYAERGAKFGRSAEAEMIIQLTRCQDYNAANPIYINDQQRNELSQLAGRLIATPDDLLTWAHNISTMKVQGVEVTLDQRLLSRIEGRRFGQSLASTIKRETLEGLERSVGLR